MNKKYYSDKQEKLVAYHIDGKQVSGSGARPFHYGDVISEEWLVECKTHTTPGHDIFFSKDVWEKIQEESMMHRKKPVLVVDDGSQKLENTWCLFNRHCLEPDYEVFNLIDDDEKQTVNLTFKSEILNQFYPNPNSTEVVAFRWHNKSVIIMPLSLFSEMVS